MIAIINLSLRNSFVVFKNNILVTHQDFDKKLVGMMTSLIAKHQRLTRIPLYFNSVKYFHLNFTPLFMMLNVIDFKIFEPKF